MRVFFRLQLDSDSEQTGRQTDRHRQTQTDRERQRETEREIDRDRGRETLGENNPFGPPYSGFFRYKPLRCSVSTTAKRHGTPSAVKRANSLKLNAQIMVT